MHELENENKRLRNEEEVFGSERLKERLDRLVRRVEECDPLHRATKFSTMFPLQMQASRGASVESASMLSVGKHSVSLVRGNEVEELVWAAEKAVSALADSLAQKDKLREQM